MLELIVVLVVLGLLAAIAIPTFQSMIDRSDSSATEAALASMLRDAQPLVAFNDGTTWSEALTIAAGELPAATGGSATAWTLLDDDNGDGASDADAAAPGEIAFAISGGQVGAATVTAADTAVYGLASTSQVQTWVDAGISTGDAAVALAGPAAPPTTTTTTESTTTTTPDPVTVTFNYTGAAQYWEVPAGVTSIQISTRGARGGHFYQAGYGTPGRGAAAEGTISVTPGETLQINVGGLGGTGVGNGGWNVGGSGDSNNDGGGGGGGGYYGGGGGGASSTTESNRGAAGGGGGSSLVPAGCSVTGMNNDVGQVVITMTG